MNPPPRLLIFGTSATLTSLALYLRGLDVLQVLEGGPEETPAALGACHAALVVVDAARTTPAHFELRLTACTQPPPILISLDPPDLSINRALVPAPQPNGRNRAGARHACPCPSSPWMKDPLT